MFKHYMMQRSTAGFLTLGLSPLFLAANASAQNHSPTSHVSHSNHATHTSHPTFAEILIHHRAPVASFLKQAGATGDQVAKIERLLLEAKLTAIDLKAEESKAAVRWHWLTHDHSADADAVLEAFDDHSAAVTASKRHQVETRLGCQSILGSEIFAKVAAHVHKHQGAHAAGPMGAHASHGSSEKTDGSGSMQQLHDHLMELMKRHEKAGASKKSIETLHRHLMELHGKHGSGASEKAKPPAAHSKHGTKPHKVRQHKKHKHASHKPSIV